MMRRILVLVAIAMCSGCVNIQTMALQKGQGALSTSTKSIALMTVEVSRADDSRYQPFPAIVWVTDLTWGAKEPSLRFQLNKKTAAVESNGRQLYLASLALSPGRYHLEGISGIAAAFPFVGNFFIPVVADFEVEEDSVSYFGHVAAIMRERREGEFRAGAVIPLVDQAATGMISHSWDVVIDDRSASDLALFKEHVPALVSVNVKLEPLPPWDRAAAQQRWDGNAEKDPPDNATDSATTNSP